MLSARLVSSGVVFCFVDCHIVCHVVTLRAWPVFETSFFMIGAVEIQGDIGFAQMMLLQRPGP